MEHGLDVASPRGRAGGVPAILLATAIAGGAGYVTTLVAGMLLGASNYAGFGVLWSTTFFVAGAIYGLQQEMARAMSASSESRGRFPWVVVGGIAVVVALLIAATSPAWVSALFGSVAPWIVAAMALGFGAQVILAAIIGTYFGVGRVGAAALVIAVDGLLRLVATIGALALDWPLELVACALLLPYLILPLAAVLAGGRIIRSATPDVPLPRLTWNALAAMGGAVATGVLISGYGLAVGVTASDVPQALVGGVLFAVNVARAPIIILVIAMQSLLVVRFREPTRGGLTPGRFALALVALTVVISALAGAFGDAILIALIGHGIGSALCAVIVASGGLVALLALMGAVALARRRHGRYVAGWVVAAGVTLATLGLIEPFEAALSVSLIVGPIAGLCAHGLAGISLSRRRQDRVEESPV